MRIADCCPASQSRGRNPVSTHRRPQVCRQIRHGSRDARPTKLLPHGFEHVDKDECGAWAGGGVRMMSGARTACPRVPKQHYSRTSCPRSVNVPFKPRPQRRLIKCQRLRVVKMPAWTLFRGATGMENCGAFRRSQTRQIQFLERRRRHGRDLRPMFDHSRRKMRATQIFR